MYGLLLRALQDYVQANFDPGSWDRITMASGMQIAGFEPLLPYKHDVLRHVLRHCAAVLDRPAPVILEDLGTWGIAAGYNGAARRLLRFCGADFVDFLYSLGELPDRARLAMPDLTLPDLALEETGPGLFRLKCTDGLQELNWILLGALRAMADDYGALVLIEEENCPDGYGIALSIRLLESHFSEGRAFDLAPRRQRRRAGQMNLPPGPSAAQAPPRKTLATAPEGGQGDLSAPAYAAILPDEIPLFAAQPGRPAPPITLARADFDHLQPLHIILSETGTILSAGPLIRRMFPGIDLTGTPLLQRFRAWVTGRPGQHLLLPPGAGQRIRLRQRGGGLRLRGITLALPPGEGVLLVLSFGIDILRAVEALKLTDRDFSATDMAMKLLCLTEANGLVIGEMRALSRRLEGARRQAEDEALTDPLTGLRNRRACDTVLARICSDGSPFSVMHLDLDHFKAVNDHHGHAAGDEVLINVAAVLSRVMRSMDCIARVGGDEFIAIIPGLEPSGRIDQLADQIITQMARPILWGETVCTVSVSIGIVSVPRGHQPVPTHIRALADKALYAAKAAGRNCAVRANYPEKDEKSGGPAVSLVQRLLAEGGRL